MIGDNYLGVNSYRNDDSCCVNVYIDFVVDMNDWNIIGFAGLNDSLSFESRFFYDYRMSNYLFILSIIFILNL